LRMQFDSLQGLRYCTGCSITKAVP
jgi:hypothetical protein